MGAKNSEKLRGLPGRGLLLLWRALLTLVQPYTAELSSRELSAILPTFCYPSTEQPDSSTSLGMTNVPIQYK